MSQANRRKSSDEGPSTARVEAIFLSPDPEDGVSGGSSKQQELWRQDQENNASAAAGPNRQRSEKSTSTGSAKTTKSSAASSKASGRSSKGKAATVEALPPVSTKRGRRPQQQSSSTDDRMTSPGSGTGGSAADSYRNRLRKTRSAMDIVAGVNRWKARPSFTSDSIVPLYASRRSSGASITVSLTCPDSPVPRLIFDGSKESPRPSDATPRRFGNNLRLEDVLSVQFVKIHQAATTVHSATRLSRPLRRLVAKSQEKQSPRRRGSTPFVPRLNLKNSPSNADSPGWRSYPDRLDDDSELGPAVVSRRASSSSEMNTPRGFFLPASRPSSTLSQHETQQPQQPNKGGYVSRKSSITSLQLANVSRPWTPAPTPPTGTRLSPVKNPYRARSPGLISNPLQSINKQVKIILGCASTILEMYNRRVESDARKSPVKSYKKEPFKPIVLTDSKRRAADKQLQPPAVSADPKARRTAKSIVNNVLGPGWKNKKSAPTTPVATSRFRSETKATASRTVNSNNNNNVKRHDPRESQRDTTRSSGRKTNRAKSTDKTPTKEAISTSRSEGKSSVKSGQQQTPQHAETKRKKSMPAPPPSLVTFMKSSKSSSSSNKNKNTSGGIPEGVSGCVGGIAGFNNWPKREQYTDKDRAAAVILGDTDIKTTLEKQLKSDRGRYVLPKESPAQVYLAQAEFEMRIGGWTIAHQLLQKALELTPGDKNALVSRSRCRLLLGDTKGALDDAEEALSNDKQCVKALFQKGEILFQLGKFEEALVFYHLGAKQRPDMEAFHQGVRKAQEAIEVSLGVKQQHRSAVPAKRAPSERKPSTARLPPLNSNKMSGSQPTVSKAMHKTPTMKDHSVLLGDLHADKVYLEKLLQNPGMRSAGDPTQKVVNYARETLEYLKARENFWRSQQPIISYKPPKDKTARTSKTQQKRNQRQSSQATITSSEGSVRAYSSPAEFDLGEDQGGDDYDAGQADPDDDVQSPGRTSQMERHEQQDEEQDSEPSANGDDHMMHLQRTLTAMRQCNEEDNMDMCIDIYLATYRKEDDLELPEEIQARINELDSMIAEEDDPLDKMQIYMEIATLFLVDGQDENCKNVCQNVLQLASSTDDVAAYIQTCLLMAAASAYSHKATNVEPHLQRAQQLIDARRIVD